MSRAIHMKLSPKPNLLRFFYRLGVIRVQF
jgi:hypothetical protein